MTWNYRLIDHGSHVAIHEVHYDKTGKPRAYAEASEWDRATGVLATFDEDARESLAWQLKMMSRALAAPMLKVEDFGGER